MSRYLQILAFVTLRISVTRSKWPWYEWSQSPGSALDVKQLTLLDPVRDSAPKVLSVVITGLHVPKNLKSAATIWLLQVRHQFPCSQGKCKWSVGHVEDGLRSEARDLVVARGGLLGKGSSTPDAGSGVCEIEVEGCLDDMRRSMSIVLMLDPALSAASVSVVVKWIKVPTVDAVVLAAGTVPKI